MSIRIRKVSGHTIALCAVESDPKPGDMYLDDAVHNALSNKFALDFDSMGFMKTVPVDLETKRLMDGEKVRDAQEELEKFLAEKIIGKRDV